MAAKVVAAALLLLLLWALALANTRLAPRATAKWGRKDRYREKKKKNKPTCTQPVLVSLGGTLTLGGDTGGGYWLGRRLGLI